MKPLGIVPEKDSVLVERAKKGDKQAFNQLVERYEKRLFALVSNLIRNKQDAEDLTQEVFVRAYFSLKNFRSDSAFYTWLYRIAYNMTIDFKRRTVNKIQTLQQPADKEQDVLNFIASENVKTPDQVFEDKQLSLSIRDALSQISEEHRAVIIMREVDGLSYDEIARITGSARGTVMSRLHYARRHMQKLLQLVFSGSNTDNFSSGSIEEQSEPAVNSPRQVISVKRSELSVAKDSLVDKLRMLKLLRTQRA